MLQRTPGVTYDELRARFAWELPEHFNIGHACTSAQAATSTALIDVLDGDVREVPFGQLAELTDRFANALGGLGVTTGDRVAVLLPQAPETAIAHLGAYKAGAVVVPLTQLFGPDAIRFRVGDSDARVLVTDPATLDRAVEAVDGLDVTIIVTGQEPVAEPYRSFERLIDDAAARTPDVTTTPDDPALLIYTSGTTGPPKGALHGHRVLFGHLPGFELSFDFFPQGEDRMWTPADWAWIGGLFDAVIPSLYHGRPVVSTARRKFDPGWAGALMAEQRIRTAFLPPTALKMMRASGARYDDVQLRSVISGGEPLGVEMIEWGRDVLGLTINEIYGQTEANLLVGGSATVWEVHPGSMGRAFPGHEVAVLDEGGAPVPTGEDGEICLRTPDPVTMLRYWNAPGATETKFTGPWLRTGDIGSLDEDGYFWFRARDDDVIISAGYRIGPGEIEECILEHPSVAMAAAIGVPDDLRGQVVKAFVALRDGEQPSDDLRDQIRRLVRDRLAAYEYPREIEFVEELPLTTTGKIRRRTLREQEERRRADAAHDGETTDGAPSTRQGEHA